MEYRVFQYGKDNVYLKDVLEILTAQGYDVLGLSEEWFHQRFEQNPLGKAILACAFENERLVACLVVERVLFRGPVNGAYVSSVYVCQDYRTHVSISELLKSAEEEAARQGIGLLFVLNKPEIAEDTSRLGWICGSTKVRYMMKPIPVINAISMLFDMGKPFVSGLIVKGRAGYLSDGGLVQEVESRLNKDYLKWLMATSPRNSCMVIDGEHVLALVALGHRGKTIQEAQIVYMESKKDGIAPQRYLSEVVKAICEKKKVNVVSCVDDCHYLTKKGSLGVSPTTHYCYKIIGEECHIQPDDFVKKLLLSSAVML